MAPSPAAAPTSPRTRPQEPTRLLPHCPSCSLRPTNDHDRSRRRHSPVTAPSTTTATRFIQLKDVAETLNISAPQTYALVRSGELPAIKVGGRGPVSYTH